MNEMTPAARERLDDYLQRMRAALRGRDSVVADDVEQSVREHIEFALAEAQGPIGATEVIGVLDRLGAPERWLADEEQPLWHQMVDRIRTAPGEWRLACLVFGLFLASLALFQFIGPLLILPAMLASRAYVEFARDRGESLGARRWLVYPAIALVLAFVVGLFLVGPPLRMMVGGVESNAFAQMFDVPRNEAGRLRFELGLGGIVFGAWWILAAGFCAAFLRPIRFVFAPLLDDVTRRHFAVLAGLGALAAAAGAMLILYRH